MAGTDYSRLQAGEPVSGAGPGEGRGNSPDGAAAGGTPGLSACPGEREARWALWRQDDNGHRFLVCTTPTRKQAEEAREAFESRGHKQIYFVEPFTRS